MSYDIITKEIVDKFPNCQACYHEWSEHTNGCSHDFCNCQAKVDSSILEQIMIIEDQKLMIDVFDDFFHIRKEEKSHEYLIQAKYEADNAHSCDSSHGLVSWKFLGDFQREIEAVFQCSKCSETFTVIYDYHGSETYEEIGIENPFLENKMIQLAGTRKIMEKNEFYTFSKEKTPEGYNVEFYDVNRNSHFICFTFSKKVADYLVKDFDNLAIVDEKELFAEILRGDKKK